MNAFRKIRHLLDAAKDNQRLLEENEALRIQNTACGVKSALLETELNRLKDEQRHLRASYAALRDTCHVYEAKLQNLVDTGVLTEQWSLVNVEEQNKEVAA